MAFHNRRHALVLVLLVWVLILVGNVDTIARAGATPPFSIDMNTLFAPGTTPFGMKVDGATLVVYSFATYRPGIPVRVGPMNRFDTIAFGGTPVTIGTIPINTDDGANYGIRAPGLDARGFSLNTRHPGANNRVTTLSFRNMPDGSRIGSLRVRGPGHSTLGVTHRAYADFGAISLPVSVRVPHYTALELAYGRSATRIDGSGVQLSSGPIPVFSLNRGESLSLFVSAWADSTSIPGIPSGERLAFAIDRTGNGIWHSEDPAIVSVTPAGRIRAVAASPDPATLVFRDYLGNSHEVRVQVNQPNTQRRENWRFQIGPPGSPGIVIFGDTGGGLVSGDSFNHTMTIREEELEVALLARTLRANGDENNPSATQPFFSYSSDPSIAHIATTGRGTSARFFLRTPGDTGQVDITIVFLGQPGPPTTFTLQLTVNP